METKIASYQENGVRLQLIEIIYKDALVTTNSKGKPMTMYQIRKNRKVVCNFKWEGPAKQKFNALIQQELLQTKMEL